MSALGAIPAFQRLYDEAFARFAALALWRCRRLDNPTPADAAAIARALRAYGDLAALRLAEQIEEAARAAD